MQIIPAVLPHAFEEIGEKITRIEDVCTFIQIDICDGVFGREKTWLPEGNEILSPQCTYEFDVMVVDWKKYIPICVALGATKIVAHVDQFVEGDMELLVGMVKDRGIQLGISVSNDKSVEMHASMIRHAQDLYEHVYIQVMGIRHIGEQGQFFDEECLSRIIELKKIVGDKTIQVDGGINVDTAHAVCDKGADAVVVGSYIFGRENAISAYEELVSVTTQGAC